jgi:hypothetical protein
LSILNLGISPLQVPGFRNFIVLDITVYGVQVLVRCQHFINTHLADCPAYKILSDSF